jgi:hypothetical protein
MAWKDVINPTPFDSMFIFFPAQENESKERALSRALRVRLRVVAVVERAETRPAFSGAQTVAASLSSTTPMLALVTMGITATAVKKSFILS